MPKPFTLPTLFDEVKTLNLSFLKKHGYLKPNQWQTGVINWTRRGEIISSISVGVGTPRKPQSPYLEFDYKYKGEKINYRVQLVKVQSNLGKGEIWYFLCPRTLKRCRKLYLIDGYLFHRSAFSGCMYEVQTFSKSNRGLNKLCKEYFQYESLYCQLNQKHLKKQYSGKPTKKYLKLSQQMQRAERLPPDFIERLLIR